MGFEGPCLSLLVFVKIFVSSRPQIQWVWAFIGSSSDYYCKETDFTIFRIKISQVTILRHDIYLFDLGNGFPGFEFQHKHSPPRKESE